MFKSLGWMVQMPKKVNGCFQYGEPLPTARLYVVPSCLKRWRWFGPTGLVGPCHALRRIA